LFVAELGNDSLGVVDLAAGKVLRTIMGLKEPQGVAYVGFADSVYVANAGDGSVQVLSGDDFAPIGRVELGDDADNVRVDAQRSRVLVGYGKGALADRSGNSDQGRRDPSQGPSRGFPDRRNRKPGLCQCAGRARGRSSRSCLGGEPVVADARAPDQIFRWRSTAKRTAYWSSFADRPL
jgi:hypothetical protein